MHADGEFRPLKSLLEYLPGGPLVNLDASNEHVPDIERQIRVAKEQCRANCNSLLFQKILKLLTSHIVLKKLRMLNLFPAKGVILDSLSPKNIMSDKTLDLKKHLLLHMGQ